MASLSAAQGVHPEIVALGREVTNHSARIENVEKSVAGLDSKLESFRNWTLGTLGFIAIELAVLIIRSLLSSKVSH